DDATASISNSQATGEIVLGSGDYVGGLVGANMADGGVARIEDAHATGAVTGFAYVGGLVGQNTATAEAGKALVSSVHASGQVSGNSFVGGLVGQNQADSLGVARIEQAHATGVSVSGSGSQ